MTYDDFVVLSQLWIPGINPTRSSIIPWIYCRTWLSKILLIIGSIFIHEGYWPVHLMCLLVWEEGSPTIFLFISYLCLFPIFLPSFRLAVLKRSSLISLTLFFNSLAMTPCHVIWVVALAFTVYIFSLPPSTCKSYDITSRAVSTAMEFNFFPSSPCAITVYFCISYAFHNTLFLLYKLITFERYVNNHKNNHCIYPCSCHFNGLRSFV